MINLLASRYQKPIGYFLLILFYASIVLPSYAGSGGNDSKYFIGSYSRFSSNGIYKVEKKNQVRLNEKSLINNRKVLKNAPIFSGNKILPIVATSTSETTYGASIDNDDIGGPTQPEMTSFKPVGTDNMVNLFTGDFSYNIPLMDVGGYPINIFYDGNITMEQEASWVGLGWNINPGTINRNMRGVPDDFDGTDILTETQNMKPNKTWGVNVSGDFEFIGLKGTPSIGGSLGVSFNNYLGPALDLGIKGGVSFSLASKTSAEKNAKSPLSLKVGGSANLNSRDGFTLSPNVSLTASTFKSSHESSVGVGLSTSYNSRSGIKGLQLYEQMSFSRSQAEVKGKDGNVTQKSAHSSIGENILSSSISFAKPSYIPSIRLPLTNSAFSGHFQVGGGLWGGYGSLETEVYKQVSKVETNDIQQSKPMVGYLYYEKAKDNPNAVMDFTRVNDNAVTSNTPIISAPQYSYDIFSIQGEGTGGSIRAYRNDLGYVRDNSTQSKDASDALGADLGFPGHYGANFNTVSTPSTIGEWSSGNKLRSNTFSFKPTNRSWENVYFRNPGESSVLTPGQFAGIGGTDLVRFQLGGSNSSPTVEPKLDCFTKAGTLLTPANLAISTIERKKRTQVINFFNAEEATVLGLEHEIKSYKIGLVGSSGNYYYQPLFTTNRLLDFETIPRYDDVADVNLKRKNHHISQINVTEADGKRYIYGIPVYNTLQKDFTFSVHNLDVDKDDKVLIDEAEVKSNSPLLDESSDRDGFFQSTQTPAYAHSFLLTGLLSPDYVDVTKDGITDDDLGNAVKFNYTRVKNTSGTTALHKWRTPLTKGINDIANFNPGHRTEVKDDKGIISYGERESWYTHSIESKTMIAIFILADRNDGKGTATLYGGIDPSDASIKSLQEIRLYSKADLKKNGLANARSIKTVHFEYNYSLCKGTPDNTNFSSAISGKLTLSRIYFTFNGQSKAASQYAFAYGSNPDYQFNASDRWGSYKPISKNPLAGSTHLLNSIYPYSVQNKADADENAAPWALNKILLPSGGQIEVNYESDEYAFVQNKRAANMMSIAGLGSTSFAYGSSLYDIYGFALKENDYVFINVPEDCTIDNVYQKYLEGIKQFSFKLAVNMPKGIEYLTCYANLADGASSYGLYHPTSAGTSKVIWIKLKEVEGMSPLSLTAVEYLREQLPGQAFPGYDVSESSGLAQIGDMLFGMLTALKGAFSDPVNSLRGDNLAKNVDVAQCFVRLNDPEGYKFGGGHRVKSIKMKDNWHKMTTGNSGSPDEYGSVYGQEYDYTTTGVFGGVEKTISSGVASYEPSIGGEENPFQEILQVESHLPLGPASFSAIEMPVLDAFFPSPSVGYSKVTVRSISKTLVDAAHKSRSGIGKQVTEYYTSKDFPVTYGYTSLDGASDKQEHESSFTAFFYKSAFDSRTVSQGFIVETNDMNGKMKSQASYPENDEKTPVNYTQNFYSNTGAKGLSETFDFIYPADGGIVKKGNMGIDVELMTDAREFSVKSNSFEVQAQVDLFPVIFPFWLPFIWPVCGYSENTYRAVTTTKVVSYHSVLSKVVVIDKGSQVSTENKVYDAETGDVVVNKTNNEFDKPVFSVKYPAYWAYSGMGPAYKNINSVYTDIEFFDGKITNISLADQKAIFESGDELYVTEPGTSFVCDPIMASPDTKQLIWAIDKDKDAGLASNPTPDLIFIDQSGKPYSRTGVGFKIVRSGKRNMLGTPLASVTMMTDPIDKVTKKLTYDINSQVVNASAVEYKEKWQTDNEVIRKYRTENDLTTCSPIEIEDCSGHLEKGINPYCKGLLGNFKTYRSMIFYGNRTEADPTVGTKLAKNGFLSDFVPYWTFNTSNYLVAPASTSPTKWVWNSQSTRFNSKGMELETEDALHIFTAAQYGYGKTMATAIAKNSRAEEMMYDGFEDYTYDGALSYTTLNNCAKKHIDFSGIAGGNIINTQTQNFNAHSGKSVLKINQNYTLEKLVNFNNSNNYFSLLFNKTTIQSLNTQGALFNIGSSYEANNPPNTYAKTFTHSNLGFDLDITLSTEPNAMSDYRYTSQQFFQVSQGGVFTFYTTCGRSTDFSSFQNPLMYEIQITEVNTNETIPFTTQYLGSGTIGYYSYLYLNSICLKKGIYRINCWFHHSQLNNCSGKCNNHTYDHYGLSFTNNFISYQDLTMQSGCQFTKPISSTQSMLNSIFDLAINKKMLFSAWVRESNTNVATYNQSEVQLEFVNGGSSNVILQPSGPIIEGWQRYEGAFTVPASATSVNLKLVNKGNQPIYFDDIRIHPYDANMKSYVYDPVNLRLVAEANENNYSTYYEYDEQGTLIRTKVETKEGIKTINETRSATQKNITTIQ